MSEWLAQLDVNSVIIGLLVGLIVALISAVTAAKIARRRGAEAEIISSIESLGANLVQIMPGSFSAPSGSS